MYGRKYMGTARITFVIDETGIIDEIISKVDTKNHAAQILKDGAKGVAVAEVKPVKKTRKTSVKKSAAKTSARKSAKKIAKKKKK